MGNIVHYLIVTVALLSSSFGYPWEKIATTNSNPVQDYAAHTTTVIGDMIYEFGGIKENRTNTHPGPETILKLYSHLRKFDTNTFTWSTVTLSDPLEPPPRAWTSMAHVNNKLYLYGGTTYGYAPLGDFWEFDLSSSKWTDLTTSSTPSPRTGPAMLEYNGNVLVYGGLNTFTLEGFNDIYIFHIPSGTWNKLNTTGDAPLGTALSRIIFHRIFFKRYLYVYGGEGFDPEINYFGYHDKMHRIDMSTLEWEFILPTKPLPRRRLHYSAVSNYRFWQFPHGDYGNCSHLDLLVPGTAIFDLFTNKWYDQYIPGYAEGVVTKRSELSCVGPKYCYLTGGYGGIECYNSELTYMNDVWRFKPLNTYTFLLH